MHEDFLWFKENYDMLKSTYGNAYLVIKNKRVLGVYNTYADGVRETAKTEDLGTFIVQECNLNYVAYQGAIASMNFI